MAAPGCLGCGSHRFSGGICLDCERPQELSQPPRRQRHTAVSTKAAAEHARRLLAALDEPPVTT
jgi:hypothetical protein